MKLLQKIFFTILFQLVFLNLYSQNKEIIVYDSCKSGQAIPELKDLIDKYEATLLAYGLNLQNKKDKRLLRKKYGKGYTYSELAHNSISSNRINESYVKKKYRLNLSEKGELYEILVKNIRKDLIRVTVASCYNPRHCLVFLDSSGIVQYKIDLCFECLNGFITPSEFPISGYFCKDTWDELKYFIESKTITYSKN